MLAGGFWLAGAEQRLIQGLEAGEVRGRQIGDAGDAPGSARAFSSEVGTGSREENASKQETRASVPIQSERKRL